jgi:hypothetical protein
MPGSSVVIRAGYGIYANTSVYSSIVTQLAQQPPLSTTRQARAAVSFSSERHCVRAQNKAVRSPNGIARIVRVASSERDHHAPDCIRTPNAFDASALQLHSIVIIIVVMMMPAATAAAVVMVIPAIVIRRRRVRRLRDRVGCHRGGEKERHCRGDDEANLSGRLQKIPAVRSNVLRSLGHYCVSLPRSNA